MARHRARGGSAVNGSGRDPLPDAALNLAAFHNQHERRYASSPLEEALLLQRHARASLAIADRWTTVEEPRGAMTEGDGS